MHRIHAIALTAFREAIRDRILFAVLGLGAASVFFGLGLGAVSYGEATRILVDHGMLTISWLSNLVAIFLGASFLYKEIELRTLYVLLAKPVARYEVILGKYLGIILSAAVFILLTGSLLLVLLTVTATSETAEAARRAHELLGPEIRLIQSRGLRVGALVALGAGGGVVLRVPRVRRMLSATAVLPVAAAFFAGVAVIARVVIPPEADLVILGCALTLAEVTVTAAFAMLFSAFSTPFVTGAMTAGAFVIGRSTWLMQHLRPRDVPPHIRELLDRLAWVIPNLHLYVPSRQVLIPDNPAESALPYVLGATAYALVYAGLLLGASSLLFRRRDLV